MRWRILALASVAAACSRAADDAVSDTATSAAGVAFAYDYSFRLPSPGSPTRRMRMPAPANGWARRGVGSPA